MKVLAVSSNCFSETNSNGRIFGCLFREINKEDVAEFYVIDGVNDFNTCSSFYHFKDKDALRSIFFKNKGRRISQSSINETTEKVSNYRKKFGRSTLMMIFREVMWSASNWWNSDLREWIDEFNPNVVVLQCGDIPFFYKIATKIAKYKHVPLVLFNTEISFFIENDGGNPLLFPIYRYLLRRSMSKAIKQTAISIYNSEWLKNRFDSYFHMPSVVIYQSSDLSLQPVKCTTTSKRIVYTGNLSWGRCFPLADIANALTKIDDSYILDVYGIVKDEESLTVLNTTPGLCYHGVVSYEEVKDVTSKACVLVVTENSEERYARQTNFGFSGKITDCLFSGIPILAYGPDSNVGLKYLKDNGAGMFVGRKEDLEVSLRDILYNEDKRKELITNAQRIAVENHDAHKNSIKFKELLHSICQPQ